MDNRGGNRQFYDLDRYPFSSDITDPDVRAAFNRKFLSLAENREPLAILREMVETRGWNEEDLKILSLTPVDKFYEIFKGNPGPELRKLIAACLQFDRIINATPVMKKVGENARDALTRIGGESVINARRVQRYGIEVAPR